MLASTGLSFGIFFMRAFFLDLPNELEQAARVDGCSEWARSSGASCCRWSGRDAGALGCLHVPAELEQLPGAAAVPAEWRLPPLTAGLYVFTSGRTLDIGPLAAGTLITIVPVIVLFVAAQRHVIRGFIAGSVKG